MDHGTIFLDVLTVSNRLRHLDTAKVASIAASMDEIGLQQPISIWASEDGSVVELVAGAHRVEAANKLGWEKIDCIFVNMNELDRQLWEIDENLMRAELGPAELAEHTAKRAEVVRQKAAIVNGQNVQKPAHRPSEGQGDFVKETAKNTGKNEKTIRRDKARGEAIPADVLAKIRGSELDKGTYLDKLRKLSRDEMREIVGRDLEAIKEGNFGNTKDVREVLPKADKKQSDRIGGVKYNDLCRAWNACSEDEQGRFLINISWDLPTWDLNRDLKKENADLKKALVKQKLKTKLAKATEGCSTVEFGGDR